MHAFCCLLLLGHVFVLLLLLTFREDWIEKTMAIFTRQTERRAREMTGRRLRNLEIIKSDGWFGFWVFRRWVCGFGKLAVKEIRRWEEAGILGEEAGQPHKNHKFKNEMAPYPSFLVFCFNRWDRNICLLSHCQGWSGLDRIHDWAGITRFRIKVSVQQ